MIRANAGWLALAPLLASLAPGRLANAHPAPSSTLRLEFENAEVRGEYWRPVSELAFARAVEPDTTLPAYLLSRLAVQTPAGSPWRITVRGVREARYLEHDFLVADVRLEPPSGSPARPLVIIDDVITHEVRNHVVFIVESRSAGGQLLGMLQYPARRLEIAAR